MADVTARSDESIDISVVLMGHDQGHLIHGSIISAERAARHARARGLSVELLLLLRAATPVLQRWTADRIRSPWRVIDVGAVGRGEACNGAVHVAKGRYIAWLDGWDLWSENWLEAAVLAAERGTTKAAVWHPYAVVQFGDSYFSTQGYALLPQPDGLAGELDYASLLDANPYPTGPAAARSLFTELVFPLEDDTRGWADVAWWWNCNAAGRGYHHCVVRKTFHYQRVGQTNRPRSAEQSPPKSRIGPTPLSRSLSLGDT